MATPLEIVRNHYDAIRRRDRPALMATLATDIDWQLVGPTTIPFGGARQGHDQVGRFFDAIAGSVEVLEFSVDRMIEDGDTVIVQGHEHFRVRTTGREWSTGWVQIHIVRDGKIRRFREYTDTAAIAAAYA